MWPLRSTMESVLHRQHRFLHRQHRFQGFRSPPPDNLITKEYKTQVQPATLSSITATRSFMLTRPPAPVSNTPKCPTSRAASPASANHATSAPRFPVTALQTSPPAMRRSRPRPSAPAPEPSFYAIGPGRTRTGGRGRPSGFGRARVWAQPWGGRSVRVVERRRRQGACGAAWWLGRCTRAGPG